MRKILFSFFTVLMSVIAFSFSGEIAHASEISTLSLSTTNLGTETEVIKFVDSSLIGTKIDVLENDGISPYTGGYLYKNISWSESNKKSTYLGKVTKGNSVSYGVNLLKGYITIGVETSASRIYNEYQVTSKFKSTWGVYDKYSGNYMHSETFNNNVSYKSYTRAK